MTELPEFKSFASIPRLSREMIVTEKIDGTNAIIAVLENDTVIAGSRSRWITPEQDNFGFARWVKEHEEELRVGLGYGEHHGEWYGSGIQRGYGLTGGEKRFALFNTHLWHEDGEAFVSRPACCGVVPILYRGVFDTNQVDISLSFLVRGGSLIVPGFDKPEGVVVFHVASNSMFKKTLDKNDGHKTVKFRRE